MAFAFAFTRTKFVVAGEYWALVKTFSSFFVIAPIYFCLKIALRGYRIVMKPKEMLTM
jgi:hypothetical protein